MLSKLEKHVLSSIHLQLYAAIHALCHLMDDTIETASGDETKDMLRLHNRLSDAVEFLDKHFDLESGCGTAKS